LAGHRLPVRYLEAPQTHPATSTINGCRTPEMMAANQKPTHRTPVFS
jgi:hypothetical protein